MSWKSIKMTHQYELLVAYSPSYIIQRYFSNDNLIQMDFVINNFFCFNCNIVEVFSYAKNSPNNDRRNIE